MKKLLLVSLLAFASAALFAAETGAPAVAKDPVFPFNDYGPAMRSTAEYPLAANWQEENRAAIDAATTDAALAAIVAEPAVARGFLTRLKAAYAVDPFVAVQLAAVTQYVMRPEPAWYAFWKPSYKEARRIWVLALLEKAESSDNAYIQQCCLEQLRWCVCNCPTVRERIAAIGAKSTDEGVKNLVELVLATR